MSFEIYYKKAFVRVEDKFIPLANHGSSNCFAVSSIGRDIPEKHWHVLNYPRFGEWLFTASEIRELAKGYEAISLGNRGGIRKSRNRPFEEREFGRWIITGMKSAHTVEEYTSYGNWLIVANYETGERIQVYKTEELLAELERNAGNRHVDLTFWDERNVKVPKREISRQSTDFDSLERFYVLKNDKGYFIKLNSVKVWLLPGKVDSRVKKFKTEAAANRYLDQHEFALHQLAFGIECIEKGVAI